MPEWEHVIPFSYCFNNSADNFVASCSTCNRIKGALVFDTPQHAQEYVRQQRIKKGLKTYPVSGLQETVLKKEKLAEVLQPQMPSKRVLEYPRGSKDEHPLNRKFNPNSQHVFTVNRVKVRFASLWVYSGEFEAYSTLIKELNCQDGAELLRLLLAKEYNQRSESH